jgi:hypothetical protein
MKKGIVLFAALALSSAVYAASPTTQPAVSTSMDNPNDPWHVTVLPAGGKSLDISQAILWNSKTGETWVWTGSGVVQWTPMAHKMRS